MIDPITNQELFFGLYMGEVVDTKDPLRLRRIRVRVVEIWGGIAAEALPWARGCLPANFSGTPDLGDIAWVLFEKGSPELPVWIGHMKRKTKA